MLLGPDVDIVVRDKPKDHPKTHISVIVPAYKDQGNAYRTPVFDAWLGPKFRVRYLLEGPRAGLGETIQPGLLDGKADGI